ncbi:hypothetical protein EMCRGX_G017926 [Ephydatia muelleri]
MYSTACRRSIKTATAYARSIAIGALLLELECPLLLRCSLLSRLSYDTGTSNHSPIEHLSTVESCLAHPNR